MSSIEAKVLTFFQNYSINEDHVLTLQHYAGYLGGLIVALAAIVYAVAIIRGKVQSNKVTWFVWIFVTGMICVSYYKEAGLVSSIWVSVAYFFGMLLTYLLLALYAKRGVWTFVEKGCLIGVAVVIVIWFVTGSPLLALNLTMLVDVLGSIPLLVTIYKDSKSDYAPAWFLGFLGNFVNLFAVEKWDWANASYPIYMLILTLTISTLLYFPNFLRRKKEIVNKKAIIVVGEPIPEFPNFKSIELGDKKEVEDITSKFPPYSDFNFTSMWSWNLIDEIALSKLNGNLVVRFTDYVTNAPFYSFIGNNNVNETCDRLLKFTIESGLPPELRLLPEVSIGGIDTGRFTVSESRDHFDYIYNIDELRDYPGRKFSKKRNHLNGFVKRFPNASAKVISLKDAEVCERVLKLFEKWQITKSQKEANYGLHDLAAMKRLLGGVGVFDLVTVGVFVENELVALFINQLIDEEYVLAHMMKADITVDDGIYAFLMQKNAEALATYGRKLFNYEQDLGLENLRIGKSRFFPTTFLKKYTVSYVNKTE